MKFILWQVSVDELEFLTAFGRDVDFHDMVPTKVHFDCSTGDLIGIAEDDEDAETKFGVPAADNRRDREEVEKSKDRYLEIVGLTYATHHDFFKEFQDSNWTDDDKLKIIENHGH